MNLYPIRPGRAVAACVLWYATSVLLGGATVLIFVPDVEWWLQLVICVAISLVVLQGVSRLLRPWYRPVPEVPEWTEDRL